MGRALHSDSLRDIYEKYREEFFPKLLESPDVPPEDKVKIKELLKKPWNQYIRRHPAIAEKSRILKEHVLRQHCGWSTSSQMPQKYLHYFGNESNENLLEAYGITSKDQQSIDVLRPKQCPNCNEPNEERETTVLQNSLHLFDKGPLTLKTEEYFSSLIQK